jgi:hybrid cluster-associated redox disulfide protein
MRPIFQTGGASMITQEMIIADIILQHPETLPVFKQYNLDCYECQIADLETLEHGAGVHKVNIDQLLTSLNDVLKK